MTAAGIAITQSDTAMSHSYVVEGESGLKARCAYWQGTLYPDVIESCPPPGSGRKHSHTSKSPHNVGGLPKDLNFQLVEPLRELFKVGCCCGIYSSSA